MVKKRLSTIVLIRKLQALDKGYFTFADLQKITNLSKLSLKVAIARLVKKKVLIRLKRGIYQLEFLNINIPKIANQLYYPSYLSFESALSRYGILSQVPYTQTFATTKRSKKMVLWRTELEYRQLKEKLFFGYKLENGIFIARPEKALLDQLYIKSRGKTYLDIKELDLKNIDTKVLRQYLLKFPKYLQKQVKEVEKYI